MGEEERFSSRGNDQQGRPLPVHVRVNPLRGRGALLGLAVGDALGTTLEFSRPAAPAFPELARGPHRGITGGGPFGLRRGQVTDDTQMAACLASSLMACEGLKVEDLGQRYVTWLQHAFDVGGQTRSALGLIAAGVHPDEAGLRVWQQNDRRPAGNGSLMRTVPLGLFYAPLEGLVQASMRESAVTHFDPRCQLACAGFNAAVAAAAHGMKPPPEMLTAAIEAIEQGAALGEDQIPEGWKQLVLVALQEDPEQPLASDYHPLRLLQLIEG